jgi:RND family efflux transporter MFP subunit
MDDAQNRLHIAKASLRESNARLARAERDLDRTRLTAPYDGRVRTERVDVGQFVSRGVSIATIYATDIVEVKLPIHDDELAFLDIPLVADGTGLNKRVPVTLRARFAGAEHQWSGEIVRTEGELDPRTRMINLIAQVSSPYDSDTDKPPLAVGLFVQADIHGLEVDDMVIMPRAALRGRSSVFVVDQENRLRSRAVEVLRIADDQVFIGGGLNPGERVCISPLDGALDGMLVRVQATGKPVEISDS